jgi:hypothetical protein
MRELPPKMCKNIEVIERILKKETFLRKNINV